MLSQPLLNVAKQIKVNNNNPETKDINKLMLVKQNPLLDKQVDYVTEYESDRINCSVGTVILEENNRMRNAINDAMVTLTQWIQQSKEKNENLILLVNKMKESLQNHNTQSGDVLKSMMEERETEWEEERMNFQKKERVSKQMIFNLQQDNYNLRKTRFLIPRGPFAN